MPRESSTTTKPDDQNIEKPNYTYKLNNNNFYGISEDYKISVDKQGVTKSVQEEKGGKESKYTVYKLKINGKKPTKSPKFEFPEVQATLRKKNQNDAYYKLRIDLPKDDEKYQALHDWSEWLYQEIGRSAWSIPLLRKKLKPNLTSDKNKYFAKDMAVPPYVLDKEGQPVENEETGDFEMDENRNYGFYFKVNTGGQVPCTAYGINGKKIPFELLEKMRFTCRPVIAVFDIFCSANITLVRANVYTMLVVDMEEKQGSSKMVVDSSLYPDEKVEEFNRALEEAENKLEMGGEGHMPEEQPQKENTTGKSTKDITKQLKELGDDDSDDDEDE